MFTFGCIVLDLVWFGILIWCLVYLVFSLFVVVGDFVFGWLMVIWIGDLVLSGAFVLI